MRALVAGATGFVGVALCERLLRDGVEVRALVRDVTRTRGLPVGELELHQGDVLDAPTLTGAGAGVDVAYYLVHSMGDRAGDFEQRELRAAEAFARMCASEGVSRVIYLGGLGDEPGSKHLRSRAGTADALERHGPPLTYFRAGMVVGPGSESYRTLRHLVARLPFMIAPRWLSTPTQPIDIDDVVAYLAAAPSVAASAGREIQVGGPDVLPYAAMLDRMAIALGKRPRPKLPVPLLTPWLSSLWIGLVTPVDAAVARPLIEGLSTKTIVTDPSGAALFDVQPIGFDASLRKAVAAERRAGRPPAPVTG
ncbi:MAG: NAD(P)H-binding protein [Thermoleophilia bacterium]